MDSIIWFAFALIAIMKWSVLSHLEITYAFAHVESHSYILMFSYFFQIHITRTTFMESWLKSTHHLFKWCHRLKVVFIAVYWQQWASLNKHFLSNTYLFVNFYCKYMFICSQVKYNSAFPIYLTRGNWIEKIFFWPWMICSKVTDIVLRKGYMTRTWWKNQEESKSNHFTWALFLLKSTF